MGIVKTELHCNLALLVDNGKHCKGIDDLEIATYEWVSRFNEERPYGELGYVMPSEVEENSRAKNQARVACEIEVTRSP